MKGNLSLIFLMGTVVPVHLNLISSFLNPLLSPFLPKPFTSPRWTGKDPDLYKTTPELIRSRGWKCETHEATTRDGYILQFHRILSCNGDPIGVDKKPVILQHGIQLSSTAFVINDPNTGFAYESFDASNVGRNLAFELAKSGRDVWLSNTRESKYATHKTLEKYEKEFYNFSYDEMAKYDVPTIINKVLKETGHKTVAYVGHSQATLIMFAFLSRNPDYAQVIDFVALSPVAYFSHIDGLLRLLAQVPKIFEFYAALVGEFPSKLLNLPAFSARLCPSSIKDFASLQLVNLITGSCERNNFNQSRVGVYVGDEEGTTSNKNIAHYLQNIKANEFQEYNYGPIYDMNHVRGVNMAFISSYGDNIGNPKDLARLKRKLTRGNRIKHWIIKDENFSHMDFVWGREAGRLVNSRVIRFLESL